MLATLRQRDFSLLWSAGLISLTGDLALIIALPLHIYAMTGSTLATAGAFAANRIPGIVFGSVAGVFVDRWDRKRTMVWADVGRAVLLIPLLLPFVTDRLGLLFVITALQGTIGLFFTPAEGALLPRLVGEDRLVTANALNALNDNLAMLLGPVIGSFLFAWVGLGGAAFVNIVSYAGSAILIGLIAADCRPPVAEETASGDAAGAVSAWARVLRDWIAGIGVVRGDQALKALCVCWILGGLAEGFFVTLGLAPFVLDVLGGSEAQVGWLATAQAVAGIAAGVIVARLGHRLTRRWLLGGGAATLGLADFSMFFFVPRFVGRGNPAVGAAMGCMVLAGAPAVATGTGYQSIVQTRVADAFRGRVFGAIGAVSGLAMVIGFFLAGILGDRLDLANVLAVSALIRVAGGILALALYPRNGNG